MSNQQNQDPLTTIGELRTEGELKVFFAGATSKEFERDQRYRPITVIFVLGTNDVLSGAKGRSADKDFILGIESPKGKAILRFLDAERPWEWESIKGTRFANNIHFTGRVRGNKWDYVSVYPDQKVERLLHRLRGELEGR